jgi:ParB family chromosome partitioning protein
MGHARALLAVTSEAEQLALRERILTHSWSVRATEADVRQSRPRPARRAVRRASEIVALEDALRSALATRVRLIGNERAGRIEIAYTSREELDRLVELIATNRP